MSVASRITTSIFALTALLFSQHLIAASLIYSPVFSCGSGANNKTGSPGEFKPKTGTMPYTFDRASETIFEGGQVKPITLSPDGTMLFVANTPANCLEIYSVVGDVLQLISSVSVGVEPVSVAAKSDSEVWVVNHISDSVSIVRWDNTTFKEPRVEETLLVGDEPRDIVFADDKSDTTCDGDKNLALITTANRGQHSGFNPLDLFRDYVDDDSDEAYDTGDARIGRASIWAFKTDDLAAGHKIIPLFSMPARGLATTPDRCTVYAASLMSGNQTSVTISQFNVPPTKKTVLFGDKDKTEDGMINPVDNEVIVRYSDSDIDPTNTGGSWLDGETGEDWGDRVGMTPSDFDVFKIAADEIWATPAASITSAYRNVGTTLFNVVVNPQSPYNIYVSNIESRNDKRYVGDTTSAVSATLMGHFAEHNITVLSPSASCTTPSVDQGGFNLCPPVGRRHLNDHLVVGPVEDPDSFLGYVDSSRNSMAQPTDMVISSDGDWLYVANFGSRSITKIPTSDLDSGGAINPAAAGSASETILLDTLAAVSSEGDGVVGGGPAGLAISADNERLYVYSRFDNALMVLDVDGGISKLDRIKMASPESSVVITGRPFLYDAQITSNNGTGSCGSCHTYGDMDMLAWDLGKPTGGPLLNSLTPSIANLMPIGGSFLSNRILRGFIPASSTTTPISVGELGSKALVNADASGTDYYNDAQSFFSWLSPELAQISRSSGTVTVVTKSPHPFSTGQKIELLNVNDNFKNSLDGNDDKIPFTITGVSGNTFTYEDSGSNETVDTLNSSSYTSPAAPNGSYPIIESISREDDVVTVTTLRRNGYENSDLIYVSGATAEFNGGPYTIYDVGGRSFRYSDAGDDKILAANMMAMYGTPLENSSDAPSLYLAPDKYLAIDRAESSPDDSFSQAFQTSTSNDYLRFYPIAGVARASGEVTVTLAKPFHYFEVSQSIFISGVTDTSFNGNFTITAKTDNTFTYTQAGTNASSSGGEASALSTTLRAGDSVYLCYVEPNEFRLSKDGVNMLGGGTCDAQGDPYFVKWTSACARGGEWSGFELSQCAGGFSGEITPDTATFIDWHPGQGGTQPAYKSTFAEWEGANKYDRAMVAGEREVFLANNDGIRILLFEGATIATGGIHDPSIVFGGANTFHPLKGPMTTQTLRGIADSGALHWRGDKSGGDGADGGGHCPLDEELGLEDCTGSSTYPQEVTAFKQFNEAFQGLLGRSSKLDTTQMNAYTQFIMRLTLPPNPIAQLNGDLPSPTAEIFDKPVSADLGNFQFMLIDGQTPVMGPGGESVGATSLGGVNCNSCHTNDPTSNLFGTDKSATFETSEQFIKVPHLRNAYQKVGMFYVEDAADETYPFGLMLDVLSPGNEAYRMDRPQVAGFGYNHNGTFDTLINFFDLNFFGEIFLEESESVTRDMLRSHARNIAMFIAAFPNNTPTVTGQQLTLRAEDLDADPDVFIDANIEEQYNLLLDKYLEDKCDLIVGVPSINGTSAILRAKGADAACGYTSGYDEKVCFDSQYDGPSYVPQVTDGTIREVLLDTGHPIKEVTFTCLPKGNEALLMRYINVESTVTRTNPASDVAAWDFDSAMDIRALWFGRANDIDVAFPKDIEILGSSDGSVYEVLTSMRLNLPDLNGYLEMDIPIKKSKLDNTYRYYKMNILSWYCEDTGGCSVQDAENGVIESSVAWKKVSTISSPDDDQDGLTNEDELLLGTRRLNSDTDSDGVNDGLEVSQSSNPLSADTDGDGWCDLDGSGCIGLAGGENDAFPLDPEEWADTDGDGDGNNIADDDDDGDCDPDSTDTYPLVAASGNPDCTFSSDGMVANGFVNGHDGAYASFIWNVEEDEANNGKLVVAGKIYNTSTYADVAVARYNLDGTLDTSFDSDGYVTTAIGSQWDIALSVAQQADGKIVVAGYSGSSSVSDAMIIVRYNTDGTLDDGTGSDTTVSDDFGVDSDGMDGVVIVDNALLDTATYAQANDIILQSDGKIVVVGMAQTPDPDGAGSLPSALDGVVLRLNADGSFDTGFSSDGIVVQKIGNYNDAYYSVVQQAGGKLVAAGRNGSDFSLVRYNTDGTLDTAFGTSGITTTDFGSRTDYGYSLVEQVDSGDTKLVLTGVSGTVTTVWTDQDVAIARYSADGVLDTSFGTSGKEQINVGSWFATGWNTKVQVDGKLVIAGHAGATNASRDIAVLRVNPDGGLDTSFGAGDDGDDVDGIATLDVGGDDLGRSIEIIPASGSVHDGKLWVVGFGRSGTYDDFIVLRHHD